MDPGHLSRRSLLAIAEHEGRQHSGGSSAVPRLASSASSLLLLAAALAAVAVACTCWLRRRVNHSTAQRELDASDGNRSNVRSVVHQQFKDLWRSRQLLRQIGMSAADNSYTPPCFSVATVGMLTIAAPALQMLHSWEELTVLPSRQQASDIATCTAATSHHSTISMAGDPCAPPGGLSEISPSLQPHPSPQLPHTQQASPLGDQGCRATNVSISCLPGTPPSVRSHSFSDFASSSASPYPGGRAHTSLKVSAPGLSSTNGASLGTDITSVHTATNASLQLELSNSSTSPPCLRLGRQLDPHRQGIELPDGFSHDPPLHRDGHVHLDHSKPTQTQHDGSGLGLVAVGKEAHQEGRHVQSVAIAAPPGTAAGSSSSGPREVGGQASSGGVVSRRGGGHTRSNLEPAHHTLRDSPPPSAREAHSSEEEKELVQKLSTALDQFYTSGQLLLGQYRVLSRYERRSGAQGAVQFVTRPETGEHFAVKFYTHRPSFEREREVYEDPRLRAMVPKLHALVANVPPFVTSPSGFPLPPFIIMEKGQSLDEFAVGQAGRVDLMTVAQALVHLAERLRLLHDAGWVHRDLKPQNILRQPSEHSWTLLDFGCAARAGMSPSPVASSYSVAVWRRQCVSEFASASRWHGPMFIARLRHRQASSTSHNESL
jgi:hypothetical protein